MNVNRMLILARRVIQQMLGDKRTIMLINFVPIILLSAVSFLVRGNQAELTVGIVNLDTGVQLAGNSMNAGERLTTTLADFGEFNTEMLTRDEAEDQLEDAKIDAAIILPEDFTQQVMNTHQLDLEVRFEGSNPMIAERLQKILERVAFQAAGNLTASGIAAQSQSTSAPAVEVHIDASYLHGGAEYDTLDFLAPALIGFFVFFLTFLLTAVSFLRERIAGTLERLQATPIRSGEIILGYMLGFLLFGLVQGIITLLFIVFVIGIHYSGSLAAVFVVEALLVVVSVNLGIFLSTFAQNEFQVLQFVPLVVVSQGLLGGIIWQIEDMPNWLQPVARLMPLTYANDALRGVMMNGKSLIDVGTSLLILAAFGVLAVVLSAWTAGRVRI